MEYLGMRDQTDLYYQKSGEGTELVMLHGWKASSDVYLKVSELLSDRYTCISYDCRGHKRSGVTGAPDLSVLAEDLNEVIGKLCTGKPVLIGWSMGGLTALEYIRKYGCEGISGLILVDVAPKMRKDETWPCGTYSDDEFYADQQVMQEIFFAFLRQYYIRQVPGRYRNNGNVSEHDRWILTWRR